MTDYPELLTADRALIQSNRKKVYVLSKAGSYNNIWNGSLGMETFRLFHIRNLLYHGAFRTLKLWDKHAQISEGHVKSAKSCEFLRVNGMTLVWAWHERTWEIMNRLRSNVLMLHRGDLKYTKVRAAIVNPENDNLSSFYSLRSWDCHLEVHCVL